MKAHENMSNSLGQVRLFVPPLLLLCFLLLLFHFTCLPQIS